MKRVRAIILFAVFSCGGIAIGLLLCAKSGAVKLTGAASPLAASTGELAAMYNGGGISMDVRPNLLGVIRQQTLILISLGPDVREFDAAGFEGMCRIVSLRKTLFADLSQDSVTGAANRLITAQLGYLQELIATEYALRMSRPIAVGHKCPGFEQ